MRSTCWKVLVILMHVVAAAGFADDSGHVSYSDPNSEFYQEKAAEMENAIKEGRPADVERLLQEGYPVEAVPFTPLYRAAQYKRFDIIKLLVEKYRADVNGQSGYGGGGYAITKAVDTGDIEIVKYLIAKGADVGSKLGPNQPGPVWRALTADKIAILRLLIENGANLKAVGDDNFDLISWPATHVADLSIVEELLKYDIFVYHVSTRTGTNILHYVAEEDNIVAFKKITEKYPVRPEMFEQFDVMGLSPLLEACANLSVDMARAFLESGADVEARSLRNGFNEQYDLTPLLQSLASNTRNKDRLPEMVHLLLSYDADVNARGWEGQTAVHLAAGCKSSSEPLREILTIRGANIEVKDDYGMTPIFWAAYKSLDNTKLLAEAGADLNLISTTRGLTPLAIAILNTDWYVSDEQYEGIISYLLSMNVDLSKRRGMDYTYLELAKAKGRPKAVELIEKAMKRKRSSK